jgi:hypothetical protein
MLLVIVGVLFSVAMLLMLIDKMVDFKAKKNPADC